MAANTCNQPPFNGNGTGAEADYVFGFEYINRADVEVYVGEPGNWTQFTEGNAGTANQYQWQNDTTIRLNAATGVNNVLITRETDRCDPVVEFAAGTSIRAQDLNDNQDQMLFLIQEMSNTLSEMGVDQPPGADGLELANLQDVNITTTNSNRWLRWNSTSEEWEDRPILEDGEAWVADDNHVVTSEAGDDRWLQGGGGGGGTLTGGDGINVNGSTVSVDLADPSGLEFNNAELRVDANNGCEIVAAGLNAETTAASIVQTAGTDADPAIRIATTLGATTTNTDLAIVGGANTTVTRDNNGQLTIASSGGTGITYRGQVDITDSADRPTDSNVNDFYAVETTGQMHADWQAVITGAATTANAGDLLQTTTAADGTAADARYTLIQSGTAVPAADTPALQAVTTEGNTSSNNILLQTGDPAVTNTSLNANGSAVFNEQGASVNFRVESDAQTHMLFVDGTNNRVGIQTDSPIAPFSVDDRVVIQDGANVIHDLGSNGNATFNEQGAAANFRVESNDNANMVFVDGSNNRVGIGHNAPGAPLDVSGDIHVRDATGVQHFIQPAGNTIFNDRGLNVDFRVESDNNANMFFVDGGQDRVGIGTVTPATTFEVEGITTLDGQVLVDQNAITAGAGNWNLQNGNFWTLAGITVPVPTNMEAGMSGLIVNTAAATWPAAGGATFQYAANTPPNITEFPAVIPFYCTNNTTIFIGTPTVNIV